MELLEAIKERHSVRSYKDKPIEGNVKRKLEDLISECNKESGLRIQLAINEPKAFSNKLHYGRFSGVRNYIALIGQRGAGLDELCGYYGEKIVLYAQQLGLNTCWVGMSYKRIFDAFTIQKGEKINAVIAIGYGVTKGTPHRIKTVDSVSAIMGNPVEMPTKNSIEWFYKGVEAALLAPTAVNQQKFHFTLEGNTVTARAGLGFYSKIDLGIVKYHFEIGAGKENFKWA